MSVTPPWQPVSEIRKLLQWGPQLLSGRSKLVDTSVITGNAIENALPWQIDVRAHRRKYFQNNPFWQSRDIDVKNSFPEGFLMRVSGTPTSKCKLFAIWDTLKSLDFQDFIKKTYSNLIWLAEYRKNKSLHFKVGVPLTLIKNASGNEFLTSISLNSQYDFSWKRFLRCVRTSHCRISAFPVVSPVITKVSTNPKADLFHQITETCKN